MVLELGLEKDILVLPPVDTLDDEEDDEEEEDALVLLCWNLLFTAICIANFCFPDKKRDIFWNCSGNDKD